MSFSLLGWIADREGVTLLFFNISQLNSIKMCIVYRYDNDTPSSDNWSEQDTWTDESALLDSAIEDGWLLPITETMVKTVLLVAWESKRDHRVRDD